MLQIRSGGSGSSNHIRSVGWMWAELRWSDGMIKKLAGTWMNGYGMFSVTKLQVRVRTVSVDQQSMLSGQKTPENCSKSRRWCVLCRVIHPRTHSPMQMHTYTMQLRVSASTRSQCNPPQASHLFLTPTRKESHLWTDSSLKSLQLLVFWLHLFLYRFRSGIMCSHRHRPFLFDK